MRRAALLAAPLVLAGLVCGQSGCGSGDDSGVPVPGTPGAPLTPLPVLDAKIDLKAIWGASATDVWAVGSNGTIVHYDGTSWTNQKSGVTENLTGIDGTSNKDIWVTGDQGSVLHWNGKKWSIVSTTPMTVLLEVWVGSSTNVWAVGLDTYLAGAGYVKHWDGTTWVDGDDSSTTSFWQVWGSGSDDVWLVGDAPDGTGVALRGTPIAAVDAGLPFDTAGYAGPAPAGRLGLGAGRRLGGRVLRRHHALGREHVDDDPIGRAHGVPPRRTRKRQRRRMGGRPRRRRRALRGRQVGQDPDRHHEHALVALGRFRDRRLARRGSRYRPPLGRRSGVSVLVRDSPANHGLRAISPLVGFADDGRRDD